MSTILLSTGAVILLTSISVISGMLLMGFTCRRWIFLITIIFTRNKTSNWRNDHSDENKPSLLLLVPYHNEESNLPGLLYHLDQLTYPQDCLKIVLIDDGSTDNSDKILSPWLIEKKNQYKLHLKQNVGKANALNHALNHFLDEELIAVYDADERPQPDALVKLSKLFKDKHIGAVSGRRALINPQESPIASYAAFENLVHQLITNQAKEILGLAPAILGSNCMYRRIALEHSNGFTPGALLEDSDISMKLARAGWRTRFLPEAISFHKAPATIRGYWEQHTRWATGFKAVAQTQTAVTFKASQIPLHIRIELFFFALGYLDRVALIMAFGTLGIQRLLGFPMSQLLIIVVALNLITPFFQTIAALWLSNSPFSLWKRIFFMPIFLIIDMAMAINGSIQRSNPFGKNGDYISGK